MRRGPPAAKATPVAGEPDTFLVALPAGLDPEAFPPLALAACGTRPRCKYMGWTDADAVPRAMPPAPPQMAAMAFSYLRDRAWGLERTLWNCALFPRTRPGGCMRRQAGSGTAAPPPSAQPRPDQPARGPDGLGGVRRPGSPPPPSPPPPALP